MLAAVDQHLAYLGVGALGVVGTVVSAMLAFRAARSATKVDFTKHRIDAALAGQGALIEDLQAEIARVKDELASLRRDKARVDKSLLDCRRSEEALRDRVRRLEVSR